MATAQVPTPGQRIRITATGFQPERIVGEVVRLGQDTLVLEVDDARLAVPLRVVTQAEISYRRHGHTFDGAAIGGLSAGAFVGQDMLRKPSNCKGSGNYGQLCAMFLLGSVVAGAAVGALVGAVIRHDDWAAVSLERAGVGFDGLRFQARGLGRAGFSVAIGLPLR